MNKTTWVTTKDLLNMMNLHVLKANSLQQSPNVFWSADLNNSYNYSKLMPQNNKEEQTTRKKYSVSLLHGFYNCIIRTVSLLWNSWARFISLRRIVTFYKIKKTAGLKWLLDKVCTTLVIIFCIAVAVCWTKLDIRF